jgi:hypothetical protein
MQTFEIKMTGLSPLLMHADDIVWAQSVDKWRKGPEGKNAEKGSDMFPAWAWIGSLYNDRQHVVLPQENIMRCIMAGGAEVSAGRGRKTLKVATASGMRVGGDFFTFTVNGKQIPMAPILDLLNEPNFEQHVAAVEAMGFKLFVKRATLGTSKHVRVRPRFDTWEASGTLEVWDSAISPKLEEILNYAGRQKGIGDWRPSSRTPGPYGTFSVEIKELR